MNIELRNLIRNRGFELFLNGLTARFSANSIDFTHIYEDHNSITSLTVNLKKGIQETVIRINEIGDLYLEYNQVSNTFINCSEEDFHTMLAHAFIYLRDGNFDYHKIWFDSLNKSN